MRSVVRRSSKALPKAKLALKKVMVTVCFSAASLIHYSFLNPSETILSEKYAQQIDEMHWKLQRLKLALVNRMGPILHNDVRSHAANQHLKSWTNWTTNFCLICHIHLTSRQLTTASTSILTTFCQKNASRTSRRQKMLSKSSLNPKHGFFFCYRNIRTFLLGKNVLIVIVPILINKDVFKPSYNALTWLETTITFVPT